MAIISTKLGNYIFTEEQKNSVQSTEIKHVFKPFNWEYSQHGLDKIWDEYVENKGGLAYLLSKSPFWRDDLLAIVLPKTSLHRRISETDITDFCTWLQEQCCIWCNQHKDSVKVNGKTISDLYDEVDKISGHMHTVFYSSNTELLAQLAEEREKLRTDMRYIFDHTTVALGYRLSIEDAEKINGVISVINMIKGFGENIANEEFANAINAIADANFKRTNSKGREISFGAQKGQKVSRIVNKFFKLIEFDKIVDIQTINWTDDDGNTQSREKDMGWNYQFAKYADAINPLDFTRTVILSVNPVDYLTMSFGNGWASCHTPDKQNIRRADGNYSGCYCSGTLSYMLDGVSLIMYTVKDDYNGNEYNIQDKVNRCVFCIDEDKIVQSRLYPDGRSTGIETSMAVQFRAIVQNVITGCVDANNLWKVEKGTSACREVTRSYGTHYRDYTHYSDCNVSYLKTAEGKNTKIIPIGHNPICPNCGCEHDLEEYLTCEDCSNEYCDDDHYRCVECNSLVYYEDAIIDSDTDNAYCCEECANEGGCYWCSNVDEWHSSNVYEDDYSGECFYDYWGSDGYHLTREDGCEYHYVDGDNAEYDGWHYINEDNEWHHEEDGEIVQCPHCNEWILKSGIEENGFCAACGENIDAEDVA